jgi:hypothetical protein
MYITASLFLGVQSFNIALTPSLCGTNIPQRKKNCTGSEKPLPTFIKEKEPLWYWVL